MKKCFLLSGFVWLFFYACQPKGGNTATKEETTTQETASVSEDKVTIVKAVNEIIQFKGSVKSFKINTYFIPIEGGKKEQKPKIPTSVDEYILDAHGRIIRHNSSSEEEGLYYEYTYHYDPIGRLAEISKPATAGAPETHEMYKYTPKGDTLSVIYYMEGNAMGGTTYEYIMTPKGKKIIKEILGDGQYSKSECFYDEKGILTKELLYGGEEVDVEQNYIYDTQGKLIKIAAQKGLGVSIAYQYDEQGNISQKASEEEGTYHYTYRYDDRGNIIEKHISSPEYTIIQEYEINY